MNLTTPESHFFLSEYLFPVECICRQMVVCNGSRALLTDDRRVVLDLRYPMLTFRIPIKSTEDDVHKIFLSPCGHHGLASTLQGENYYFWSKTPVRSTLAPIRCDKLQGLVVEAVGWSRDPPEGPDGASSSSGPVLIGTRTGQLVETELSKDGAKAKTLVFDFAKAGDPSPVTGLVVDAFSDTSPAQLRITATTSGRIYQFVGGPGFQACLSTTPAVVELPEKNPAAQLSVWYDKEAKRSKSFLWSGVTGVCHGRLRPPARLGQKEDKGASSSSTALPAAPPAPYSPVLRDMWWVPLPGSSLP
eukprot:RCo010120